MDFLCAFHHDHAYDLKSLSKAEKSDSILELLRVSSFTDYFKLTPKNPDLHKVLFNSKHEHECNEVIE